MIWTCLTCSAGWCVVKDSSQLKDHSCCSIHERWVIQYPQTPPAVCSLGRCTAVTSLRYMYLRVILHLISFVLQLLLPPSKVITKSYRGAGLMFEGFWLSWKGLTWTCELWQKCLLVDYFFGLEQSILVHFVFFSWLYITLVFSCYTVEPVVTPCCHWVINQSYPSHQLFCNIWGEGCHWIFVQSAQVIYVCMYVCYLSWMFSWFALRRSCELNILS